MDMVKNKTDKWIKCISKGGNITATAIVAPQLIREAAERHELNSAENSKALKHLGETLLASLLLVSYCKEGERISLSVRGDGEFQQAIADANPNGTVRGFIFSRKNLSEDFKPDPTRGPWQNGLLTLVRLRLDQKEPYNGTVELATGHLAKDLTFYLSQSEQIPSAIGIEVDVDSKGEIKSAGGFIIQVMPGATDEEIALLEKNIKTMESLTTQLAQNSNPTVLLAQVFNDMIFTIINEREVKFECHCTKDKVSNAIRLLGKEEVLDMIATDKGAHVKCDFCSKNYQFEIAELAKIVREQG